MIWELFANLDNNMVRVEFNAAKGEHYLRTSPVGVPFDFRLAISDALRCLRSSLDYVVSAMARKASLSDKNVTFPFHEKRGNVIDMFKAKVVRENERDVPAGTLHDLGVKYPDLQDLILNEIQPFSAEDGAGPMGDLIWRLITMDNIDKHRLLTPTINFTHVERGSVGGIRLENLGLSGWGPDHPAITVVGAPNEPQPEPDATMDVIFPEGTRLAGKPVLSAFVEGSNFVTDVIRTFETKFEGQNTAD